MSLFKRVCVQLKSIIFLNKRYSALLTNTGNFFLDSWNQMKISPDFGRSELHMAINYKQNAKLNFDAIC